jgi:predicted small lipoprotein YifL
MLRRIQVAAISRAARPAATILVLAAGSGCGSKQPVEAPPPEPAPCATAACVVERYQESLRARDYDTFAGLHHPEFAYAGYGDPGPPIRLDLPA